MTEEDPPVLNRTMEDMLAECASEEDRSMMIRVWIALGLEYLARQDGREAAVQFSLCKVEWLRSAQPSIPWRA